MEKYEMRAGDDRVCGSTNSFFNNNKESLSARAGDDRVCGSTNSFFNNNKESLNVQPENDVERAILSARCSLV